MNRLQRDDVIDNDRHYDSDRQMQFETVIGFKSVENQTNPLNSSVIRNIEAMNNINIHE